MNSPANNLFVSSNAASAINTVLPTSSSYILIIGLVGVLILLAVWATYSQWSGSPWFGDRFMADFRIWDWLPAYGQSAALTPTGAIQVVPTAPSGPGPAAPPTVSTQTRGGPPEHWCFVGEDLAGRWCVKVPSAAACSAERYFESRSACELVNASAMPLGVQKNGGAGATPLSSMKVQ